ncbi:PREDICTED: platelet-derived growth factor D [Dipodomys ordii]|uniref:Platelet-derived growth factor D n=1 Tax=Dipodomys ordii TaxID=10020 RepID=A0A1S3EKP4_DIPOR|nr:PREDICTED: platelet-derived growth factor D [Dipodomys ordii]
MEKWHASAPNRKGPVPPAVDLCFNRHSHRADFFHIGKDYGKSKAIAGKSGTQLHLPPPHHMLSMHTERMGAALLLSEGNHLTDLYRRDETIQVTGNGHVQSPRFPSSYPRNLLLTWRLHSQEKTRIQLTFDHQFGLEEAENEICRYDFVEVEDVSETSTVVRGRWCGHKEVPPRITSRTNQIKITFKSDDYFVAKPGFKIYYSFVKDFQPVAASENNWESVTSPISGVSYNSPSVTDPNLTADALDKTVAQFDTVEDVLKYFNPESWQEDLENLYVDLPQYRGRLYYGRKSKGKKTEARWFCVSSVNSNNKDWQYDMFDALKSDHYCQSVTTICSTALSNSSLYGTQALSFAYDKRRFGPICHSMCGEVRKAPGPAPYLLGKQSIISPDNRGNQSQRITNLFKAAWLVNSGRNEHLGSWPTALVLVQCWLCLSDRQSAESMTAYAKLYTKSFCRMPDTRQSSMDHSVVSSLLTYFQPLFYQGKISEAPITKVRRLREKSEFVYTFSVAQDLSLGNEVHPECFLCGGFDDGRQKYEQAECELQVLRFEPGLFKRRGRAKNMALVDIQLDHHERCDCICSSRPPR